MDLTTETIIPIGTTVKIGNGEIEAIVYGVAFYMSGAKFYSIVYWKEKDRKEIWMSEGELQIVARSSVRTKVGFSIVYGDDK